MARPTKKTSAAKSRPKAAAKKPVKAKPAPKRAPAKRPVAAKKSAVKPKAKAVAKPIAKKATPKGPPAKPAPKPKTAPVTKAVARPGATAAPKPAAPPPKPEPPRKPRKPELTPKEIAGIKAMLLEQRQTFSREFASMEEASNISQSELSGEVSFDEEYADAGSFTFEREKELSIGNNIRDLLDKVDHALAAIERGTYGICENCGNPIAKARLLALPYSTLCLSCKQQDERTR